MPLGTKTYTTGLWSTATGTDFCGDLLIAPKFVLTAAHCQEENTKYAAVGTNYLSGSSDGERIKVVKQTVHSDNNSTALSNGFLILELATASKITPVALSTADGSDYVVGTSMTVMGWGTIVTDGGQSRELLNVAVSVVSNAVCAPTVIKTGIVDRIMLCAGGVTNKDSCHGDSGGLLTMNKSGTDAFVGVVSWVRAAVKPRSRAYTLARRTRSRGSSPLCQASQSSKCQARYSH